MSWNRCGTVAATKTIEPGSYVPDLVADGDPAAAAEDVVDLVLGVRLLQIGLARREDVQPDAQVGNGEELEVGTTARRTAGGDIGELMRFHVPSVAGVGNHSAAADVR